MSNVKEFPPVVGVPSVKPRLEIHGFNGAIIVQCSCGGKAFFIPILPGANAMAECPNCRTIWTVPNLRIEGKNISCDFGFSLPQIMIPKLP